MWPQLVKNLLAENRGSLSPCWPPPQASLGALRLVWGSGERRGVRARVLLSGGCWAGAHWPRGAALRCRVCARRLDRAGQTYFFPIRLTDQLLPSAVFYATAGPLVLYFAVHRLVIKPYLRAQREK